MTEFLLSLMILLLGLMPGARFSKIIDMHLFFSLLLYLHLMVPYQVFRTLVLDVPKKERTKKKETLLAGILIFFQLFLEQKINVNILL